MTDDQRPTRDDLEILEVADAPDGSGPTAPPAGPLGRRPPVRERAPTSLYQRPVAVRRASPSGPHPAPVPRPGAGHGFGAAHRQLVELCPFPLFQLDTTGRVLWANEPCCELLGIALRDLFGKELVETRLGVLYPLLREDLSACVRERNAPALKRVLEYEDREGRTAHRVCWIVPERNAFGQAVRLFGYLQPLVL